MQQRIEAPDETDVDTIARQFVHADDLVLSVTGTRLSGRPSDLTAIQATLDSKTIEAEATYSLQALGIAFGKVFIDNHENYDWWIVEDEYGRDPAIRYKETTLLLFPQTMISRRVEEGKAVNVQAIYEGLEQHVEDLLAENYPDA
jgi:Domain of unknown function (DUF3806)